MTRKKDTVATEKEAKPRKPEPPKVPTLLKDFMEGKSSTQSMKMEAQDYEGILALAAKFPEFKAVSFKDIHRKAVAEATKTEPATGNPQLAAKIEEIESLNKKQASDLEKKEAFLAASQGLYRNSFTESFHQLKAQAEQAIPQLFGLQLRDSEPFLLSNADFISLLVDYAAADNAALPPLQDGSPNPDAQFPSESACTPFIKRYTDAAIDKPLAQTVSEEITNTDTSTGNGSETGNATAEAAH